MAAAKDTPVTKSTVIPDKYEPISLKFASDDIDLSLDEREGGDGGFPFALPPKSEWTRLLCNRIQAGVQDRRRNGFDDNVRNFRNQYESTTSPNETPWDGACTLQRPVTRSIVDTLHANIYKAIFGVSPYFRVDADSAEDTEAAWIIEQGLQAVFTGPVKLAKIGRKAILKALIDGTVVLLPWWQVKVQKKRSWEQVTQFLLDATQHIASDKYNHESKSAAKLLKQLVSAPIGSWKVLEREDITYDGVCVDIVDILDFGMYPSSVTKIEDAQVSWAREWLTADELSHKVKNGEIDGDAVAELLAAGNKSPGRFNDISGGDRRSYDVQGLAASNETFDDRDRPYEIFKGLARCDAGNDGLPEWVLFYVALNEEILLSAQVYPYFHDRPFFVPLSVYQNPVTFYGYSLCGILQPLQVELDSVANQRIDNGTLQNTVSFLKKRGTKWNPETVTFKPGMVWEVDNVDDIKPLDLGQRDQSAFAEEDKIRQDMQQVSAVTDTLLSQQTKGDTTLGETELSNQGANTKFDLLIDAISDGFAEVANQTKDLYAQYMPEEMTFNAGTTAVPVWTTITRDQMQSDVQMHVYGTAQLQNRQMQAQLAEKVQMMAERLPFTQEDLTKQYNVAAYVFERFGVKDFTRFIGTYQEAQKMQQDKQQAGPPPPERKINISEKADEVMTLALAFKDGLLDPQVYLQAAEVARQAGIILLPQPKGADVGDATDSAAGYQTGTPQPGTAPPPPVGQQAQPQVPSPNLGGS